MTEDNITLPKIKIVDTKWDGDGKIMKHKEIEVHANEITTCERLIDKYKKG